VTERLIKLEVGTRCDEIQVIADVGHFVRMGKDYPLRADSILSKERELLAATPPLLGVSQDGHSGAAMSLRRCCKRAPITRGGLLGESPHFDEAGAMRVRSTTGPQ
jgi:hypothetical protein